jgi:transcriptional regulator with XRE-family HTH domain
MDNITTGGFIRQLRKEKDMTQKQLADLLYITDRAVSKWERGICAPDISILEPLAEILGVSIVELIRGERAERPEEPETSAKEIIRYSRSEVARKIRGVRKKYLIAAAVFLAAAALVCGVLLWRSGRLFVLDEAASPDGTICATVYSKRLNGSSFSFEDGISVITEQEDGLQWRVIYGDCTYRGLWWSPDSRKYVLALDYADESRLTLSWLDRNSSSNLSAYLSMGVEATELRKYGYSSPDGWPEIDYRFLQWGTDSASMLIYYSFEDAAGEAHTGYFWYNCETGAVEGILEMDSR